MTPATSLFWSPLLNKWGHSIVTLKDEALFGFVPEGIPSNDVRRRMGRIIDERSD
jgi:hypothetical protein